MFFIRRPPLATSTPYDHFWGVLHLLDRLDRDGRTALQLAVLGEDPGSAAALLAADARPSSRLSANARIPLLIEVAAFVRSVGEFVQPNTQTSPLLYQRIRSPREQVVLGDATSMSSFLSRSTSPTNTKTRGEVWFRYLAEQKVRPSTRSKPLLSSYNSPAMWT